MTSPGRGGGSSHHGGMFFEVMLRNAGVDGFVMSRESGNEAQKSDGQHCVANVSLKHSKNQYVGHSDGASALKGAGHRKRTAIASWKLTHKPRV